jgi:hypothetical protein
MKSDREVIDPFKTVDPDVITIETKTVRSILSQAESTIPEFKTRCNRYSDQIPIYSDWFTLTCQFVCELAPFDAGNESK